MSKKLTHTKKYASNQITQIGPDDDAPTPFWVIRKQIRARLVMQQPHLSYAEIEHKVNRIIQRGMKVAA